MNRKRALAFTAVLLVAAVAIVAGATVIPSPGGHRVVTAEVYLHPQVVNEICVIWPTTETSAQPVTAGTHNTAATTTTETVTLSETSTIYMNVTIVSDNHACTEFNPHYGIAQSSPCGPCA